MSVANNESLSGLPGIARSVAPSSSLGVSTHRSKSLVDGLRALVEETDAVTGRLRVALQQLIERLDRGEAPAQAVASLAKSLPAAIRVLLAEPGEMERAELVLPQLVQHLRRVGDLRAGVRRTLLLPLFCFVGAAAIPMMALLVAGPMLGKVSLGAWYQSDPMPMSTRVSGWICHAAADYPIATSSVLLASLAIAVGLLRIASERLPRLRRYGAWSGPRSLFRNLACSEFLHLLAVFVGAGMSVPSAVRRAAEIDQHVWLREQGLQFAGDLDRGVPTNFAVQMSGMPWSLEHLLRDPVPVTARSESLRTLGDSYALRAEEQSRTIAAALVPVSVLVSAVMVTVFLLVFLEPFRPLMRMMMWSV